MAIYANDGLKMCQLQQARESPIKYLLFSTCKRAEVCFLFVLQWTRLTGRTLCEALVGLNIWVTVRQTGHVLLKV
ncbi:unnamed protein product [Prunus armeniaca]|uniref:Uncharacterized protein n=1 Tax=Prunus armeniaca TaxID=36596 RepID=A0A6J5WTS9_PRUAR|nr:unnamed protein product [Prunus armeniaca]